MTIMVKEFILIIIVCTLAFLQIQKVMKRNRELIKRYYDLKNKKETIKLDDRVTIRLTSEGAAAFNIYYKVKEIPMNKVKEGQSIKMELRELINVFYGYSEEDNEIFINNEVRLNYENNRE